MNPEKALAQLRKLKRPTQVGHLVDSIRSRLKTESPEEIKESLVTMLQGPEFGLSGSNARGRVSEAFKLLGIRFRSPGGGRKPGVSVGKPTSATNVIRAIETVLGKANTAQRRQIARILAAITPSVQPSMELVVLTPAEVLVLSPQKGLPTGTATASPSAPERLAKRKLPDGPTKIVIDDALSERAEDLAEQLLLRPQYGSRLVRVGHRIGESKRFPGGMVPGADFYVISASNKDADPVAFIEIKSVTENPPFNIVFTRAEYLRAKDCVQRRVPYRLILVDVNSQCFPVREVENFDVNLAALQLSETVQFVAQLRPSHHGAQIGN